MISDKDLGKRIIAFTMAFLVSVTGLAGCGKSEPSQTVEADGTELALVDGEELTPEESEVAEEGRTVKTSEKLDVNNLPEGIAAMVPLCDAINIVQIENAQDYSFTDSKFVWKAIQIAIVNGEWDDGDVKIYNDKIQVEADVVYDYAYAMFGKLKSLPNIPEELTYYYDDNSTDISITNDFEYLFSMGDRGNSIPRVVSATAYSDASVEIQVRLAEADTGSEIAGFIYTMRSNTRDTSAGARFEYEITSVRVADTMTSELMKGKPYILMVEQAYGENVCEDGDGNTYSSVKEIPFFATYGTISSELSKLNKRIRSELLALSDDYVSEDEQPDESGDVLEDLQEADEDNINTSTDDNSNSCMRILAYPISSDKYIQAIVSYESCPDMDEFGVQSYVYDMVGRKALELSDALSIAQINSEQLYELVKQAYESIDTTYLYDHCEYQAFRVLEDDSIDFYVVIYMRESKKSKKMIKQIAAYNNASGELRIYNTDEDIVPEDEVDTFNPPLTHGR